MGAFSRLPTDNRPIPPQRNPWGTHNVCLDDTALLLAEKAKRCLVCKRVILNQHLREKDGKPHCPDCAGKDAPLFFKPTEKKVVRFCGCGEDGEAD